MNKKKTTQPKETAKPQLKVRDLQPRKDAKGGTPNMKPPSSGDPCEGGRYHD